MEIGNLGTLLSFQFPFMLEAKLLLDDPLLSIAQIADELNFSDQSFFGKFFKRHMGISPKEYRLSS